MDTKFVATLCASIALVPLAAQKLAPRHSEVVAFSHVTVIDVSAADSARALQPDYTVVLSAGRITAVGRANSIRVPADATVVEAAGKFLIPGLWDMHAHLLAEDRLGDQPGLYIANGVTGVRVMGSALPLSRILEVRTAFGNGERVAPRIGAVTGRMLENANGRPDPVFEPIATVEDAHRAVVEQKTSGADFIKVYNRLTRDMYLAVVDEAKRQKISVAGHIPMSMTALEVSDLGQRTIEHSGSAGSTPAELLMSCSSQEDALRQEWQRTADVITAQTPRAVYEKLYRTVEERASASYDERKCTALFARFARNDTWHVPTLVLDVPATVEESANVANPQLKYIRKSVRERWLQAHGARMQEGGVTSWKTRVQRRHQLIGAMHAAGVRFMAGTDAMQPYVVPGFSLHDELALLVSAGLTPLASLRTATLAPAQFLGVRRTHGTVQRGKMADLVLLDANPLEDIANTRRIAAVAAQGRYFPRQMLDQLLAEVEGSVAE
jgi:hypothetical protein